MKANTSGTMISQGDDERIHADSFGSYCGIIKRGDCAETRWLTKEHGDGGAFESLYARLGERWFSVHGRASKLDGPVTSYGIRWEAEAGEIAKLEES